MTGLLQVSDPHFGTEQGPVVEALVALAVAQRPGLVVLSGDITQRARRHQFAMARAFADRLGAPVLAVPGNHDIPLYDVPARLFQPYAHYAEAFGNDLEPEFSNADLLVIGLNTTRWYRHQDGELSPAQIDRVARRLGQARPTQLRVVVVHQPVAVQRAEDLKNLLHGHAAALPRWAAAGADLVLSGHIHLPGVQPLPGLVRPMWAVQAGTAVSSRVRAGAPNSVNLLLCGADAPAGGCRVEQWDIDAGRQAFQRVRVTDLQTGSPGRR